MSKVTHTPGPWKLAKQMNGGIDFFGEGGQRVILVNARLMNEEANARLIAAAPDLLAVAEKTDELIQMFVGINSPDEPYLVYSLPREVQDMIFELTAITHAAIATAKGK